MKRISIQHTTPPPNLHRRRRFADRASGLKPRLSFPGQAWVWNEMQRAGLGVFKLCMLCYQYKKGEIGRRGRNTTLNWQKSHFDHHHLRIYSIQDGIYGTIESISGSFKGSSFPYVSIRPSKCWSKVSKTEKKC